MNLNNFESYIDKKILARGYDYFENDCVSSIEEIDDNYKAEVEGTDLYTVEVELDDKANIIDTQCDYPYDMGEYCKHQVAVFLTLRDMKNNFPGENSHFPQNSTDSEAVLTLFLQYIEQTAARADNRKDYQGVCAIIRNLKKAGGNEQALEIKQKLFNKYANRPAFRDELSRV